MIFLAATKVSVWKHEIVVKVLENYHFESKILNEIIQIKTFLSRLRKLYCAQENVFIISATNKA